MWFPLASRDNFHVRQIHARIFGVVSDYRGERSNISSKGAALHGVGVVRIVKVADVRGPPPGVAAGIAHEGGEFGMRVRRLCTSVPAFSRVGVDFLEPRR